MMTKKQFTHIKTFSFVSRETIAKKNHTFCTHFARCSRLNNEAHIYSKNRRNITFFFLLFHVEQTEKFYTYFRMNLGGLKRCESVIWYNFFLT